MRFCPWGPLATTGHAPMNCWRSLEVKLGHAVHNPIYDLNIILNYNKIMHITKYRPCLIKEIRAFQKAS